MSCPRVGPELTVDLSQAQPNQIPEFINIDINNGHTDRQLSQGGLIIDSSPRKKSSKSSKSSSKGLASNLCHHTNSDYCDNARSIDQLLEKFCLEREKWLDYLIKDPDSLSRILWTSASPISIDPQCMFQMGKNGKKLFMRAVRCPQCRHMDRFVDLLQYKTNTPFLIECGDAVGSTMMIVNYGPLHNLGFIPDFPLACQKKLDFTQHALLLSCQNEGISTNNNITNNIKNEKYYRCDTFTNEVLITTFINDYLDFYHIPTTNRLHTAFVCGNEGYILYESPQLYQITPSLKIVEGIMYQLISTLDCLSKQQFTHGSLDLGSITLVKMACDYDYDGVRIAYDFTLKLGNFKLSSITINDGLNQNNNSSAIRIYPSENISEKYLCKIEPKDLPELFAQTTCNRANQCNTATYYKPTLNNKDLLFTIRHSGIPLFGSSFDTYGFMVMLMSRKDFYDGMHAHHLMRKVWDAMLSNEDQIEMKKRLESLHQGKVVYDASFLTDYLRGMTLRCDVLPVIWKILKSK